MSFQQLTIVGNIGRDPELTYTPQGTAVCKFSVACNKTWGKGDEKQQKTTWFRITAWKEKAEMAAQYLKKGQEIMIIGEVDLSVYVNKSGEAAGSLEVTANQIVFVGPKQDSGERATQEQETEAGEKMPF